LTDPAELRRWWGDADLDLADGGRFALRWFNTDEDGNVATLDGAITKLDPPRLLEISAAWGSTGSDDPGAPTTLTWELDRDGDQTLLRFKNTVTQPTDATSTDHATAGPSIDDANEGPTAADTRTAAGWHMHLDALAAILSGGDVDLAHPEPVYEPIHEAYAEKYGRRPNRRGSSRPLPVKVAQGSARLAGSELPQVGGSGPQRRWLQASRGGWLRAPRGWWRRASSGR
jgi:uncharacterized protein YndB with AHSA1/START domain